MADLAIYLLAISLLLVAARGIFQINVRRDYLHKGRLSVTSVMLQALVFFAYGGFPRLFLRADWPVSYVRSLWRVTGQACIAIGLTVLLMGALWLGLLRSLGRKTDELIVTGPYRLTRNPQVLGCGLYIVGFVILWPSWYAVGWGLAFVPIFHMMVLTEEEHLINAFGEAYKQYCETVPRYLSVPMERLFISLG